MEYTLRKMMGTARDIMVYSLTFSVALIFVSCVSQPTVLAKPVQCEVWSVEAVDELTELMSREASGELNIAALKLEIKKMNRVCEANAIIALAGPKSLWSLLPFID